MSRKVAVYFANQQMAGKQDLKFVKTCWSWVKNPLSYVSLSNQSFSLLYGQMVFQNVVLTLTSPIGHLKTRTSHTSAWSGGSGGKYQSVARVQTSPPPTLVASLQTPRTPTSPLLWGGHCKLGWYEEGEQCHQWEPAQHQADRHAVSVTGMILLTTCPVTARLLELY